MNRDTRVSTAALRDFSSRMLCAAGANGQEAAVVADCLVWSDQAGLPNQGLWRLPLLLRNMQQGGIRSPCNYEIDRISSACAMIRGGSGFGHYLCQQAAEHAVELARQEGIACVTVNDSNFAGALSYYVNQAAEQGCMALMFCNSFPKVAAFGGRKPLLGTNPLAFAAPADDGDHFILDMSTAMSAGSTITRLQEQGAALPKGIAVDRQGNAITDAARLNEGALLPLAGAKGFGLALMVELLAGVLTSAAVSTEIRSLYGNPDKSGQNGHCLIAINVSTFMDSDHYQKRYALLKELVLCERETFHTRFPGQRKWQNHRHNSDSVELDIKTRQSLATLARQFDLPTPWAGEEQTSASRNRRQANAGD